MAGAATLSPKADKFGDTVKFLTENNHWGVKPAPTWVHKGGLQRTKEVYPQADADKIASLLNVIMKAKLAKTVESQEKDSAGKILYRVSVQVFQPEFRSFDATKLKESFAKIAEDAKTQLKPEKD